MLVVQIACCVALLASQASAHQAFVIALDKQKALYASFVATWAPLWRSMSFERFPAVQSAVRGKGICRSILGALETAQRRNVTDSVFIFEPDALPFTDVDYNACDWNALDDTYAVYFLGGHNIHAKTAPNFDANRTSWTPISGICGCYAMRISLRAMSTVVQKLRAYCLKEQRAYAVDTFLASCVNSAVATPLLVDHPRTSYSETWTRRRVDAWAGQRHWMHLPVYKLESIAKCT